MTLNQAKFLVKATEDCGNQEAELHEDYSGRGMYGETTCGIVVDSLKILLVDVINYVRSCGHNDIENIPDFKGLRTDSMGRSIIIY